MMKPLFLIFGSVTLAFATPYSYLRGNEEIDLDATGNLNNINVKVADSDKKDVDLSLKVKGEGNHINIKNRHDKDEQEEDDTRQTVITVHPSQSRDGGTNDYFRQSNRYIRLNNVAYNVYDDEDYDDADEYVDDDNIDDDDDNVNDDDNVDDDDNVTDDDNVDDDETNPPNLNIDLNPVRGQQRSDGNINVDFHGQNTNINLDNTHGNTKDKKIVLTVTGQYNNINALQDEDEETDDTGAAMRNEAIAFEGNANSINTDRHKDISFHGDSNNVNAILKDDPKSVSQRPLPGQLKSKNVAVLVDGDGVNLNIDNTNTPDKGNVNATFTGAGGNINIENRRNSLRGSFLRNEFLGEGKQKKKFKKSDFRYLKKSDVPKPYNDGYQTIHFQGDANNINTNSHKNLYFSGDSNNINAIPKDGGGFSPYSDVNVGFNGDSNNLNIDTTNTISKGGVNVQAFGNSTNINIENDDYGSSDDDDDDTDTQSDGSYSDYNVAGYI